MFAIVIGRFDLTCPYDLVEMNCSCKDRRLKKGIDKCEKDIVWVIGIVVRKTLPGDR